MRERSKVIHTVRVVALFRRSAGADEAGVAEGHATPEEFMPRRVGGELGRSVAAECRAHRLSWGDVGPLDVLRPRPAGDA